jgi:hypothetical protein
LVYALLLALLCGSLFAAFAFPAHASPSAPPDLQPPTPFAALVRQDAQRSLALPAEPAPSQTLPPSLALAAAQSSAAQSSAAQSSAAAPVFPYPLLSGNVRLRAYLTPPVAEPAECADEYSTHVVSPSLTCDTKTHPGAGLTCFARRVVIDGQYIKMSRGGEAVADVMGRTDEQETAHIHPGAFTFAADAAAACAPASAQLAHVARSTPWAVPALTSLCGPGFFSGAPPNPAATTAAAAACASWDDTLTLVVQRFEYVNLYHTATELAAAVLSLERAARLRGFARAGEPARVVFLDGHARGSLDDVWRDVFGGPPSLRAGWLERPLCASRVVFAEIGYSSHANIHPGDAALNAMAGRAAAHCVFGPALRLGAAVARAAGAAGERRVRGRALFVMRDAPAAPAHPRVRASAGVDRSVAQADQYAARVAAMRARGLDVQLVHLSQHSLAEQVRAVRAADAVVGVHGAALTHLLWANPDTLFVELSPQGFAERMHFVKLALVKGQRYARLGPGADGAFLSGAGAGINLSPDMLESVLQWALLESDTARLGAIAGGGSFM